MKVLAISSSRVGAGGFLENARPMISQILGEKSLQIAFIPFASAENDYEAYAQKVREALSPQYNITAVLPKNAQPVIDRADVIMVGGGNTFKLLHDIYEREVFELVRQKVSSGIPYIGWSAGANITGSSIATTNDMPIIQPASFKALEFFPFQINPHYVNQVVPGHNGETRDQRLQEFLMLNPNVPVVALPEGTALMLDHDDLRFVGQSEGALFQSTAGGQAQKSAIPINHSLAALLRQA